MPGPVSDPLGGAPNLIDRMRVYAKQHPDVREEFLDLADKCERALLGEPVMSIPRLVRLLVMARRRWCEETGEPM